MSMMDNQALLNTIHLNQALFKSVCAYSHDILSYRGNIPLKQHLSSAFFIPSYSSPSLVSILKNIEMPPQREID